MIDKAIFRLERLIQTGHSAEVKNTALIAIEAIAYLRSMLSERRHGVVSICDDPSIAARVVSAQSGSCILGLLRLPDGNYGFSSQQMPCDSHLIATYASKVSLDKVMMDIASTAEKKPSRKDKNKRRVKLKSQSKRAGSIIASGDPASQAQAFVDAISGRVYLYRVYGQSLHMRKKAVASPKWKLIGVYDEGCDWRDVAQDIAA